MKKILSIILTAALIIGLIPATSVSAVVKGRIAIFTDGFEVISRENAKDVLGDGTVSYDYATNTLTLDGADLTGIQADSDLNIFLTDSENTVYDKTGMDTSAIYVNGDLCISGNGTLTSTANGKFDSSYGIYVQGSMTIDGANVTAKGGDVLLDHCDSYETSYAKSNGVFADGNITVKGNGILRALAGKTYGYAADSAGIHAFGINVYKGNLYAESGEAEATSFSLSQGIFVVSGDINIHSSDSVVDVEGGFGKIVAESKEEKTDILNYGILVMGGDLNIYGGKVNVYAEGNKESSETTFGIEVANTYGYNEETGVTTDAGGHMNIASDNPEETNIEISSLYGSSIVVYKDLNIDKMLDITVPADAIIRKSGFSFNLDYGPYYHWTITDKTDAVAKNIKIVAADDVNFVFGDVNDDEKVTASDALLVLKHSAKLLTLRGYGKTVADIEYDEKINADDALQILKWAARIEG